MNTKLFLALILPIGFLTFLPGCSTTQEGCTDPTANNYDADATEDDGSCTYDSIPNNGTDTLCDGIGSTSYYPLALGNKWSYSGGITGSNTSTVQQMTTQNSVVYFMIDQIVGAEYYYRVAPNGDIYELSLPSTEALVVPANPTVNQQWNSFNSTTKKVISLNETVSTPSCTYSGCLYIMKYSSSGAPSSEIYYKSGIGLVKSVSISGGYTTNLSDIELN